MRGNGICLLFECAELVAYVSWLLTGILPPLYQAFSRSVRRDVIPALSSVDTTAHSQQRIVPRSWGPRLFLLYWLYLKHFGHINNTISWIRWSLSEPYTQLQWLKIRFKPFLHVPTGQLGFMGSVWMNKMSNISATIMKYHWLGRCQSRSFILFVALAPSRSWWASCSTGHSWIHNLKRIQTQIRKKLR